MEAVEFVRRCGGGSHRQFGGVVRTNTRCKFGERGDLKKQVFLKIVNGKETQEREVIWLDL